MLGMIRKLKSGVSSKLSEPHGIAGRSEGDRKPNPYLLAFFTAICASALTLSGNYFLASRQMDHIFAQKELELRKEAYKEFLSRVDRKTDPWLSELLNIGSLAEVVATDMEIAVLEQDLEKLLQGRDPYDLYWQLNSDLNAVRLAASPRVKQYSGDLLNAVAGDLARVDFSKHPTETQHYCTRWQSLGMEPSIGFEPLLSKDSRLSIIIGGRLFGDLVSAMADELAPSTTDAR